MWNIYGRWEWSGCVFGRQRMIGVYTWEVEWLGHIYGRCIFDFLRNCPLVLPWWESGKETTLPKQGMWFDLWSRKTPHARATGPVHHGDGSLHVPGPEPKLMGLCGTLPDAQATRASSWQPPRPRAAAAAVPAPGARLRNERSHRQLCAATPERPPLPAARRESPRAAVKTLTSRK